jgi:hypothetical protein
MRTPENWIRGHMKGLIFKKNVITSFKTLSPNIKHCKVYWGRISIYEFGKSTKFSP